MRFEKGHKAATRRHIVDVASKCVRRDGISAAGIAGIMAELSSDIFVGPDHRGQLLAYRDISRCRTNLVANGIKRT